MIHNRYDKARMNVWMKVVMDNSTADARLSIQFYNENHKWQHVFMLVGDRFQIFKRESLVQASQSVKHCPLQRNMGPLWPSTRCKCSLYCVRHCFIHNTLPPSVTLHTELPLWPLETTLSCWIFILSFNYHIPAIFLGSIQFSWITTYLV